MLRFQELPVGTPHGQNSDSISKHQVMQPQINHRPKLGDVGV
jgi:hypothetical protein